MSIETPEHNKRSTPEGDPMHLEINAAYSYVNSVIHQRDMSSFRAAPFLWKQHSMREAFLAGISYINEQAINEDSKEFTGYYDKDQNKLYEGDKIKSISEDYTGDIKKMNSAWYCDCMGFGYEPMCELDRDDLVKIKE